MLNHHERRALHEIQRQLLAEDRGFVQSLNSHAEDLHRPPAGPPRRAYTIALAVTSICGLILLLAGSPLSGLALVAVTVVIWTARRHGDTAASSGGDAGPAPRAT